VKTESKSTHKQRHKTCSKYTPIERTARGPRSVTKTDTQTPYFGIYSRRALSDPPQTLHGDRARRGHQKWESFFDPMYSFPTGCTEKFGLIDRRAVSQQ